MSEVPVVPAMTTNGAVGAEEAVATSGAPRRRVYNPVQKDYATFLKTAEESNGDSTLLEIEVEAGGGNALHYHTAFAEHFTVLSGELSVQVGKETHLLKPGETAVAPVGSLHRFYSTNPTTFQVELRPGHAGFERAVQIAYGLAGDRLTNDKSMPKNIYHAALLVELADTHPQGPIAWLLPLLRLVARRARQKGIERELVERYCQ